MLWVIVWRSVPGKKVVFGSDMVAHVKEVVVQSVGSPFLVDLPIEKMRGTD